MGDEHAVEEWLPGGVITRTPAVAEVDEAAFTLDGHVANGSRANGRATIRPRDAEPQPKVDLNEVDFEGLVALGISVGQAARFISQRERRGGISAVSEVDGYYGLAPGVREILRGSGRV